MKKKFLSRLPIAFLLFFVSLDFFSGDMTGRQKTMSLPAIPEGEKWTEFDDGDYHGLVFKVEDGKTWLSFTKNRKMLDFILASGLGLGYLLIGFARKDVKQAAKETDTTNL